MSEIDIPASWTWSAAEIAQRRWRKVLIIGAVDRGKSTYCAFLSRYLMAAGWRVAIVDADIGQKDIGPPATITLGYPDASLARVPPAALYFVGAVSPVGHLLPMVLGTRRLVDAAQGEFVLINTTGLVQGVGRVLKGYKIEAVRPDVIVAVEQSTELQPITRAYRHYRTLRIQPSTSAMVKTSEQRREARERAFGSYFQTATEAVLPCRSLIFQRRDVPTGFTQHLLCGVADRRNKGLGLAIIIELDWSRGTIVLLTPVAAESIRIIQGGDLYLTPDGYELGRT
ncbi:MAG TPA: Clp1/GlmU family protein [Candidatus Tectomicrobia bacterium]|jgi:polynucleotide 5'-hydroxyl-kinase GRC3/NOL9